MRLYAILVTMVLGVGVMHASTAQIESISKKMIEAKATFELTLKSLEVMKKELQKLKEQYNIAPDKQEKNELAKKINAKDKETYALYQKAVNLKERFNTLSYQLAKAKHTTLERILAKQETVVAQKEQSCRDLDLKECQKKAYDTTKKEAERLSDEAIKERVKESGIEVDPKKIAQGVQTNIQRFSNLDHGYFYAVKSEVNADLTMDEYALFDVDKITWNEMFDEPVEIAQIPLDDLPLPEPEPVIEPEEIAPPVYHAGPFVSLVVGNQSHTLASSKKTGASAYAIQLGYKSNDKDRIYYEHELITDGLNNDLTFKGVHMDWSINLEREIYPFWGLGYSQAELKGSNYRYEGSAYHGRLGVGYELRDDMELDLTYRSSKIFWVIANGNTNIGGLGLSRDVSSYNFTASYLF